MCDLVATKRSAWRASLSEEEKALVAAETASWKAEETKAERMGEFAATFASADTNSDGLLTGAEFADMMQKLGQNAAARGVPHPTESNYTDEEKVTVYAWMNSLTEGAAGVSMADMFTAMQAVAAAMQAM